jgi:hypothetical protein
MSPPYDKSTSAREGPRCVSFISVEDYEICTPMNKALALFLLPDTYFDKSIIIMT